jgi:hypothetical protein
MANAADGYLGYWLPHSRCDDCQLERANAHIAELEAQLAALDWREITETDLPPLAVFLEVFTSEGEIKKAHRELEELADDDMSTPKSMWWSDYEDQEVHGVTHFRTYAPPVPRSTT